MIVEKWLAKTQDDQEFQINLTYGGNEGYGYVISDTLRVRSMQIGRNSEVCALARAQLEIGENIARSIVVLMTKIPKASAFTGDTTITVIATTPKAT